MDESIDTILEKKCLGMKIYIVVPGKYTFLITIQSSNKIIDITFRTRKKYILFWKLSWIDVCPSQQIFDIIFRNLVLIFHKKYLNTKNKKIIHSY